MIKHRAAIINAGDGAWAFETRAQELSQRLGVPVIDHDAVKFGYLLAWDRPESPVADRLFIPYPSIICASDKRSIADAFARGGVNTPESHVLATDDELRDMLLRHRDSEWVLKWPNGCGAGGHRMVAAGDMLPSTWPRPFLLQEFIRLRDPEVYRLYAAGGEPFGWNVRRFPKNTASSPWVAHARGARYEDVGVPPEEAVLQTELALKSTGLWDSFGCADLLKAEDGRWLVLEVNTDGGAMHVDRDVPLIGDEIDCRIAAAFHRACNG